MKVVFLDIDGVLNRVFLNGEQQLEISNGELIDEEKIIILSGIIKKTNAVIVIHSGWRYWLDDSLNPLRDEVSILLELLHKYNLSIYDKTPDFSTDEIRKTRKFSLVKAKEIISWLEVHKEVVEFLVLDDLDLHNEEIAKHQIKTASAVGLTVDDIDQAIRILSGIY